MSNDEKTSILMESNISKIEKNPINLLNINLSGAKIYNQNTNVFLLKNTSNSQLSFTTTQKK